MKLNALSLINIQVSGAICLPVILIGVYLGIELNVLSAIVAIFIGNIALLGIGSLFSLLGYHLKAPSLKIAERYLGSQMAKALAIIYVLAMLYWFSIQHKFVVSQFSIDAYKPSYILVSLCIAAGVFISLYTGIKTLTRISKYFAVFALIFCICSGFYQLGQVSEIYFETIELNQVLNGVILITSFTIVAVNDFPTFFQFADSKKSCLIANVVIFCIALPAIESLGVLTSLSIRGFTEDISFFPGSKGILVSLSKAFIILAGITTNQMNLYSIIVNSEVFLKISYHLRTLFFVTIGVVLSFLPLLNYMEQSVSFLALPIISMSALTLLCGFKKRLILKNQVSVFILLLATSIGGVCYLSEFREYAELITALITFVSYYTIEKHLTQEVSHAAI